MVIIIFLIKKIERKFKDIANKNKLKFLDWKNH